MQFFSGIQYNVKGLVLAFKTPSLLILGLVRFFVVVVLGLVLAGMILVWHEQILSLVWKMPENQWLVYLWHVVSWLVSLFLVAVSMLLSYLGSQIIFGVFIMDYMSRITERLVLGHEEHPVTGSWFEFCLYLIRQEIPRAVIPVLISLAAMLLGLLTPLGPVILILSSAAAISFMAWDNTDLVPARRMKSLAERFSFFRRHLWFHLGFGLWFLIPWVNILFLSYAPVGATLYALQHQEEEK